METQTKKILEIVAVIITGLGKFILMDYFELRFLYIATAILFWCTYIYWRYKVDPNVLNQWGFRRSNFKSCFLALLPWALVSVMFFVAYGLWASKLILSWHIVPIFLLYPLWGVIQQFLMVSIIAGNLQDLGKWSKPTIIVFTALVFGSVHLPSVLLTIGTTLLALVYTHVFLKYRNIWPLGLYHGWLGAFFFYFVMERDIWQEVFGIFF